VFSAIGLLNYFGLLNKYAGISVRARMIASQNPVIIPALIHVVVMRPKTGL
jgi:hypothetical protein